MTAVLTAVPAMGQEGHTTGMNLDGLRELLTEQAQLTGAKELYCAQDVADGLEIPEACPGFTAAPSVLAGGLHGMLAVNVIITLDSPPGAYRMVRHADGRRMTCEVRYGPEDERGYAPATVTHEHCQVVAEGILEPDGGSSPSELSHA